MNHLTSTSVPSSPKRPASVDGSSQSLHVSPIDSHKEPDVIAPPENFAVVEQGLYRSSFPSGRNFPFLRSLHLTTVIILSSEKPARSLTNFFDNHGARVVHTGLHGWSPDRTSWKPIAEEVVKETLEIILEYDNYPILVCDAGGIYLVGMVIGCLRRLQNWNLNSVVNEYRYFAASKTRYINEQFIELFDIDLITIPQQPPAWFAEQLERDRLEREELSKLTEEGLVDECGTLVETGMKTPKYLVYYFSSSGPLNSEVGSSKPRVETL